MTDANQPDENGKLTITLPSFLHKRIRRIPKSTARAVLLFFALGAGLGLMLAIAFETASWYWSRPLPPRDLGSADFSPVGLKGKLVTRWDEKVEYRVRFEPIEKVQAARFALTVKEPPHPIRIRVYLSDSSGFTLCSKEIVLKFDFYRGLRDSQQPKDNPVGYVVASEDASENERKWETDRDIFHNDLNSDGNVGAISAQGEMICSKSAYREATRWGISSNFPTASEQDDLVKNHIDGLKRVESLPFELATGDNSIVRPAAQHGTLEGDEVVSGYLFSTGNVETNSGRTFCIYKEGEKLSAAMYLRSLTDFHYKCDKNRVCELTRPGTQIVLHARLKK
jgi:hypothetical protein